MNSSAHLELDSILIYSSAHFGEGRGPILTDDVRCVGTEIEIWDCQHTPAGTHDCQHSEDAGVACTSKTSLSSSTCPCGLWNVLYLLCCVKF